MFLYLLRHGDAQTEASLPDEQRALTAEGIVSVQRVARALEAMMLRFDAVYTSPLLRARETAELALSAFDQRPAARETEFLKVGFDFQKLFELLNRHSPDAHLLLVGHEPYFSQLISTLLTGTLDVKIDVRKSSLCCVEVSHPIQPCRGSLKWLLPPQMMEVIRQRGES